MAVNCQGRLELRSRFVIIHRQQSKGSISWCREHHTKKLFASDELKYFQKAQERVMVLYEELQRASNKLTTSLMNWTWRGSFYFAWRKMWLLLFSIISHRSAALNKRFHWLLLKCLFKEFDTWNFNIWNTELKQFQAIAQRLFMWWDRAWIRARRSQNIK